MRIKVYILTVLVATLIAGPLAPQARTESAPALEYQVKAAFLLNFTKFVDWPEEKFADKNDVITIGIIGKDPFGDAFDGIEDKKVKNHKIVVKRFKNFKELAGPDGEDKDRLKSEIEALRKCYMLFVCSSEKEQCEQIIQLVEGHSVLTVGEVESFMKAGGVINFFLSEGKVHFEINATLAKKAKLKIRSKLLRLAKKSNRKSS